MMVHLLQAELLCVCVAICHILHVPVASDPSFLILLCLAVKHGLHCTQLDVKTVSLNSPLIHGEYVRFFAVSGHPYGHTFAKVDRSLCGIRQVVILNMGCKAVTRL